MVDEEREKVKIFLEAPPSQYEDLLSYAEYKRERFRDLADCVNREAVRGYLGAGNKAESSRPCVGCWSISALPGSG